MKIGLVADGFSTMSRTEVLDHAAALGLDSIEFGTGNWSSSPHLKLDRLLESAVERDKLLGEVRARGLAISALNCSGNPLHPGPSGAEHDAVTRKTVELAALLKLDRVVMMSGLPGAPGESRYPNWIVNSWPPETLEILDWQWKERIIPYWRDLAPFAERHGVRLCLEQIANQCVYNAETFFRLRDAVGPTVGVNFDPSHLLWMGGDPVEAIKAQGEAIYHVHGKDTRIEPKAKINGLLEAKPVQPLAPRAWNYVALGHGEFFRSWQRIVATLAQVGYDDVISMENEDYLLDPVEAVRTSTEVLKFCLRYPLESQSG